MTSEFTGQDYRVIAFCGGGDDDGICSISPGKIKNSVKNVRRVTHDSRTNTVFFDPCDPSRVDVNTKNVTPSSLENLHRKQSNQTEPNDHHIFAQPNVRDTNTLHSNGTDGGKCGVMKRHATGDRHTEVPGNNHIISMVSHPCASTGYRYFYSDISNLIRRSFNHTST